MAGGKSLDHNGEDIPQLSPSNTYRTNRQDMTFGGNNVAFNPRQVLDSPIVQEIDCPASEACYVTEIAAGPNDGRVRPPAELEVMLLKPCVPNFTGSRMHRTDDWPSCRVNLLVM